MKLLTMTTIAAATLCAATATAGTIAVFDLNVSWEDADPAYPTEEERLAMRTEIELTQGSLTATFRAGTVVDVRGTNTPEDAADGQIFGSAGSFTEGDFSGDPDSIWTPRIGQYPGGAGIFNSRLDNSHTVDGSGFDDYVEVSFNRVVNVISVMFGFVSSTPGEDDVRLLLDTDGNGRISVGDSYSARTDILPNNNPFSIGLETDFFALGAFDSNDSWKLRSVTVEYDEPPAVPLPAAGWMLIAGLGGMAALRRRKRAS